MKVFSYVLYALSVVLGLVGIGGASASRDGGGGGVAIVFLVLAAVCYLGAKALAHAADGDDEKKE